MTIAIDFDGTIVEHKYPKIGDEIPFATDTLKMLIKDGHRLILWSVREGDLLQEAVDWCHARGVEFWAVNKDYPEEEKDKNNHFSRKLKADMFIDDRNFGGLPDWGTIYQMITAHETWESRGFDHQSFEDHQPRKKKHWWNL
ncbi:BT0820 family HAD-type phosphatase [uncultured Prevotella sp.]|uniref:BT0820 family HAD-type phosphatase n=1 Tax=uncultured Prevotella sp. TaxID=159272 RepID=UPI00280511A1|nr:hypothetical protein [uncultured Prevotella sp.]